MRTAERIRRRHEELNFAALNALSPLEEIGPIGQWWGPVDKEAVGLRKVVERQPCPRPGYGEDRNQRIPQERRAYPCHRSEEHTSELQSLMRISYAVFCLKK